jgi:hypothetical protein
MVVASPITPSVVDAVAMGVFAKPDPFVVEAYSAPDQEPKRFNTQRDLAEYMKAEVARPRGLAFVFVVYPDMSGKPVRKTIHLDPKHCPGQTLRYTWDGWGMISIQLHGSEQFQMSRIAANSVARANAWAPTHPEWSTPDVWNWKAVESHTRRLQRILKKVT